MHVVVVGGDGGIVVAVVVVAAEVGVGLLITAALVVVVGVVESVDNVRRGCEACLAPHALNERGYIGRRSSRESIAMNGGCVDIVVKRWIAMGGRCVDVVVMSVNDSRWRRGYDNSSVIRHRTHIREGSMMMWSNLCLIVFKYCCYSFCSDSFCCYSYSCFLFVRI